MWLICNIMAKFSSENTPKQRIWNDDAIFIFILESTSWSSCIYKPKAPTATDHFVYYGQRKLQLDFKSLLNRTTHLNEKIIAWMGLNCRFPQNYQTNQMASHLVFGLFRTGHMVKEPSKVTIRLVVYLGKRCHDGIGNSPKIRYELEIRLARHWTAKQFFNKLNQGNIYWSDLQTWNGLYHASVILMQFICKTMVKFS